jgi:hypothetical protein
VSAVLKVGDVMERYRVSRAKAYRMMGKYGHRIDGCLRVDEARLARAMREAEWRDSIGREASGTPGGSSQAANDGPSRRGRKTSVKHSEPGATSNATFSVRLVYPRGRVPR